MRMRWDNSTNNLKNTFSINNTSDTSISDGNNDISITLQDRF